MSQFTITGDGHVFQFTVPAEASTTDHPHLIYVGLGPVDGTVDGVSGYTFFGSALGFPPSSYSPVLAFRVAPLPSGIVINPLFPTAGFELYGSPITTLVSDVPNPNPTCYSFPFHYCDDLLTFAFIPGTYSLSGYDPGLTPGRYRLDIATVTPIADTPEPASWMLALTGALGLIAAGQRKRAQNRF